MKFLQMLLLGIFITVFPFQVYAQSEELDAILEESEVHSGLYDETALQPEVSAYEGEEVLAKVIEIVSESEVDGIAHALFRVQVDSGEEFLINTQESRVEGLRYKIKEGDHVFLQVIRNRDSGETMSVFLIDVKRTSALYWMIGLFIALVLLIGRWRGLAALFGIGVTIAILFGFIFPLILGGSDPVLVTVIGGITILAVNMHLSHGFNKGTLLAFLSTVIGLALVAVFAYVFVGISHLSGLASEEAVLLYFFDTDLIVPKGILLAGIILGAVGVLDDIAVTQSETVHELKKVNPDLSRSELFVAAMRVGRHHIASTVNTLVLAYAGVAVPLILLFLVTPEINAARFLNEEAVFEEIVRTIAGTMGLILTVPLATWLATFGSSHDHLPHS